MKTYKLILIVTFISHTASAQINTRHYLYSYDSAGNIISRVKTINRDGQNVNSDDDDTNNRQGNDCQVIIKTDLSWSEVQVEIIGEIKQGDKLTIYTSEGHFVSAIRIQSNTFILNLSKLRKGTYLFRFSRNRNVSESKIVKQY